jgi:hypothetical protein
MINQTKDISFSSATLGDMLRDLGKARYVIAGGMAICALFAAVFLWAATPYYRAALVVTPANPMSGAEVSSLLANDDMFALRYMVQRVGVTNASDFSKFETVFAGVSVAEVLLQDDQIMRGLMAERRGILSPEVSWTAQRLAEYVQRRVDVEPIGATALRRMVYSHPDPRFAVYFLTRLHDMADRQIRQTIRRDTTQRVNYLQAAIDETNNPDHRRALTALLLEQERLRMLVSMDQPYAAEVVEEAAASSRVIWPQTALVLMAAMAAGAILGFIGWSVGAAARKPAVEIQSAAPPERRKTMKYMHPSNDRRRVLHRYAAE